MRTHIQIVGFVHVVYNLLAVLAGLFVIALWLIAAIGVGAGATASGDVPPEGGVALSGLIASLGMVIGCAALVPSLPGFLGGIACLKHRPWARLVLIIVSAVHVLTFVPTSVIIGLYSLWVLLQPETKAIFEGYDWIPQDPPATA